ncbi:MAG: RIP metalloprotease RseP [Pseudomonadota bacterium]
MDSLLAQGPLFLFSLIFMLGVVVVIHELGHYLIGRWYGAAAESFSVGFGKPLIERRDRNGTRWRINRIPFGGFVQFVAKPEDFQHMSNPPQGKAFQDVSLLGRSLVMLGGPFANFLLAVLIFMGIFLATGEARSTVAITQVAPGSPAERAGFEVGDRFLAIDDKPVENVRSVLVPIQLGSGREIPVEVDRAGTPVQLTVIPERQIRDNGIGQKQPMGTIGVGLQPSALPAVEHNPATALVAAVQETGNTVELSLSLLGRIVTGKEPLNQLSGPVGIGDVTRRVVTQTVGADHLTVTQRLTSGALFILQLCALISIGIGLFNLLPLPVLDGGHLVFNAYEAIAGKAVPEKVQEAFLTVGMVFLIGIAVFVTWGDIVETGVFATGGS